MSACVPTRATDSNANESRTKRVHQPHSPPPPRPRRFRVAGADVSASIAVFLIALPLSLGIALATGAPLQAGLVAAAAGGLVAGLLGGCPLQVSGPAAGLTVVTADLIHRYGWRTTCAVTVLAGLAQLALGCVRVARTALAVSPAIVHGMLAGIGVTIAVAQLHIVLGGTPQSSVLANLRALPAQLADLHPADVAMSMLTLALLLLWPRVPGRLGHLMRKIPAALVAVAGATLTASLTGLSLAKVDLPSWSSHALAGLPEGPVLGIAAAVLTTTLVCSVQSLLGAVAVDKLVAGQPGLSARVGRSDLNRELLGQGAANIVSGALGGLPVAGVAVRSSANVQAGAVSRNSTMLHGVLVVVAALLMVPVLELIPLASLAALVMAVGIQMVSLHHIRTVTRHREVLVYAVTTLGVVFLGVLEGVLLGVTVAVAVALNRLAHTHITHDEKEGVHHVHVRGQLTFLAVPRLSRTLHLVPQGAHVVVELDGSFMDHAAYESLQDWQNAHTARGGSAELTGRRTGVRDTKPGRTGSEATPADSATGTTTRATSGKTTEAPARTTADAPTGEPTTSTACRCHPWTPWRNHQCDHPQSAAPSGHPGEPTDRPAPGTTTPGDAGTGTDTHLGTGKDTGAGPRPGTGTNPGPGGHQLARGISAFQRNTAPLVRGELARLAREGQRPSQLFLTCADSRLVTSMITSSGPGDLFVVRNVGNLVPPPGEESGDNSVAAAIEYAVDVLRVRSITVCGHSGCGAMQALLNSEPGGAQTPLKRWLRNGLPSLERMADDGRPWARLATRAPADAVEQLCLTNVVQQLEHLRGHESVARALREGALELHGMYFHVGEAQAYLLTEEDGEQLFDGVGVADMSA
ncbi:bifunctional SulP family inorganic anion transporter/carbonic anhydrase [Streptomyces sp. NBC_00986]|uniref:bifunctional SulP family inorganic anion transporter/carbonic anhydrase n=1 Tax=Streptomyces sp. NBC_00986 TaxID=2903702 RepID=UPI0038704FD5|nr:SulP family inorganic anion transporter [Streptomyces sp. NBC_00986]